MRTHLRVFAVAALLATTACGQVLKPDTEAAIVADAAYADLSAGRHEELMAKLPEEFHNPTTLRTIGVMRDMLPEGQAEVGELVGWHTNITNGMTAVDMTHRYDYPGAGEHIISTAKLNRDGDGKWSLIAIHVRGAAANELDVPVFQTRETAPPPVVRDGAAETETPPAKAPPRPRDRKE